ncbi:hypothetical protein ACQJBY_043350 [Aegilops geniculata]
MLSLSSCSTGSLCGRSTAGSGCGQQVGCASPERAQMGVRRRQMHLRLGRHNQLTGRPGGPWLEKKSFFQARKIQAMPQQCTTGPHTMSYDEYTGAVDSKVRRGNYKKCQNRAMEVAISKFYPDNVHGWCK